MSTKVEEKDPYAGMTDDEIVIAETRYEHEMAQNALRENGHIPWETETHIGRYFRFTDCCDEYTADVVIVDRTTGQEVMRYDGADPANTNSYYGAIGDGDAMAQQGLSIAETIEKASGVKYQTADEIMARYPQWESYAYDYDDYDYDDRAYEPEDWD